jgi:DNA invertase Pin-like site-specific DNA recombinase
MNNGKVAIYARVSTIDGRQDYNRQIDDLIPVILNHKFLKENIDIYKEEISGYKKKGDRPELSRLMEVIKNNPKTYQCIYTTEISRIGRDPKETRQIVDEWTDLGLPIYIQSLGQYTIENSQRNFITSIILQVLIEYADLEAKTFKIRSKSGLLRSAKQGKVGGGKFYPYGYRRNKKDLLVVDLEESKVIERIFNLYKNGSGIRVISNILNRDGVKTRTSLTFRDKVMNYKIPKSADKVKWTDSAILGILNNSIYCGKRRFKDEIIPIEPIISQELFDECNYLLKNKNTRNYTSEYVFLLKDLIKCGVCGRNYTAKYKPVKGGDKVYVCSSTLKYGGSCGNKGLNIKLIESSIYNELLKSNNVLKYLKSNKESKESLKKEIFDLKSSKETLNIEVEKKSKESNLLLKAYLDESIELSVFKVKNDEIQKKKSSFEERLKIISKELIERERRISKQDDIKVSKKILVDAINNRSELKDIFSQIINKVIINNYNDFFLLANIYLNVNGEIIPNTIKYLIDKNGVRKKSPVFRYKSCFFLENEPLYKDGILISEIKETIEEMFNNPINEFVEIPITNLIETS